MRSEIAKSGKIIMLIKNTAHLLVSIFFALCVYSCTISQVGGYRCRRIIEILVMAFSLSAPLGAGSGQGGIALEMWEKRIGRRDEVKVVPWVSLSSPLVRTSYLGH